jgi:hypothetical protein
LSKRRRLILLVAAVYGLSLVWGQLRLPFAAIKGLADYRLLSGEPSVSAPLGALHMLSIQKWYLNRAMTIVTGTQPPRISANVQWNYIIVARVQTGHYIAPMAAEAMDRMYLCVFGAWVPVYTFSHGIA